MKMKMNEVTIIGLGAMGSMLARALLQKNYRVTVWNRTIEKAEQLVSAGASLASSVAAAVGASPVTIVCVSELSDLLISCLIRRKPSPLSERAECSYSEHGKPAASA